MDPESPILPSNAPESTSGGAGRVEQDGVDSFKQFEASQLAEAAAPKPEGEEKPATEGGEEKPAAEVAAEGEEAAAAEGGEEKPAAEAAKPAEKAAKPAKKSAKERIGELVKDRSAAERRAEEAEARATAAEEKAAALERGEKPKKQGSEAAEAAEGEPDPDKFEYGVLDPAYLAAVRAFDKAELRKEMKAERQADAAAQDALKVEAKFDAQVEALDAEVGDYVEVVVKGAQESTWACTAEMNVHIKTSDVGAKIAYHLAKNPAESVKVAQMGPIEQAKWFGRKEVELAAPPVQGKPTTKAKVSQADPPAAVVKGADGKFRPNPATTDFAAFEKAHAHLLNS